HSREGVSMPSQAPVKEVTFDPLELRRAYGCFPSGVAAICALIDGVPQGLVASSFTCVSLEPALVSFAVRIESKTWPRLRLADVLGVSVLASQHAHSCRALAAPNESERFSDVEWTSNGSNGAVQIRNAVLEMECRVANEVE